MTGLLRPQPQLLVKPPPVPASVQLLASARLKAAAAQSAAPASGAGKALTVATGRPTPGLGLVEASAGAEFTEDLRRLLTQTSSGKVCILSRSCKKYNCPLWHPGGRDIEDDPSSLFCYFGRQCTKAHCSYLHAAGRELDEDLAQACADGMGCSNMMCKLKHPYNRRIVNPIWCFACNQAGHIRKECMQDAPTFVQIGAFPGRTELLADGADKLLLHITAELEAFGALSAAPKFLKETDAKTVARFVDARSAQHAVDSLSTFGFEIELCRQPIVKLQLKAIQKEAREQWYTVFVGNISFDTTESDLRERFSRVGHLINVRLPLDKDEEKPKGYAFCDFADRDSARLAISELHGAEIHGRRIRVTSAGKAVGEPLPKETFLIIYGFPADWSKSELEEFLKIAIQSFSIKSLTILPSHDTLGGIAKVVFHCSDDGQRAWALLNEQKICGKSLHVVLNEGVERSAVGFKTEMCRFHISGECQHGERCTYAHSFEEKRSCSPSRDKACTVFIGNVPNDAVESELYDMFERVGEVVSVRLIKDKDENRPKGYGFCQYKQQKDAETACAELNGVEIRGRPLKVSPADGANLGESPQTVLQISGFPATWSEPEVETFLRSVSLQGEMEIASLEPVGDGLLGCAKVAFKRGTPANQAYNELQGRVINGEPLSVNIGLLNRKKNVREDRADKARESQTVTVHLDELGMPRRPDVRPCSADCEVWVDPLPDEADIKAWLTTFGEVDEVFRISDEDTGEPGHKGYLVFKEHASAALCVASGSGSWSESERALSSQSSARGQGRVSIYPKSLISLLLGSRGESISKLKTEIGAAMLNLRGEGVGGSETAKSNRLHFVCRGTAEALAKLHPALERHLAEVHDDIKDRIAKGGERRSRSRRKTSTRTPQSNDEEGPWRPPENEHPAWSPTWPGGSCFPPPPSRPPPNPQMHLQVQHPHPHWPHVFDPRWGHLPPAVPNACGGGGYAEAPHPFSASVPAFPPPGVFATDREKSVSTTKQKRRGRSKDDTTGEHRRRRRHRQKPSRSPDRTEPINPYLCP
eukprot:TRINITY_DN9327_c1_g2_i1.p1 TRINITY_DN9327_c1_g2~~TRINITY_DN9327_c1_g2_i1.p1  ORF type:complete len:1073 (-),score=109.96 TRINITY_DN9327_c1_g2_i1:47-3178(-)